MSSAVLSLNDGNLMPAIGLGTYLANEGDVASAVKSAIVNSGYRHIDTAFFYGNEREIGSAVNDLISTSFIKRNELFIVTKLWNSFHDPENVEKACRKSLANLKLSYIDLFLMHTPMGYKFCGMEGDLLPKDDAGNLLFSDVDYVDTWKAMEKLVELNLVKSIGVSNFNSEQIKRILESAKIKPVVNQVECSPNINQKKLIDFCKEKCIVVTAFSPLGRPQRYEKNHTLPKPAQLDEKCHMIAIKKNKTPTQVILRYLIQNGCCAIPKSTDKNRIDENINIFDFELDEDEMKILDSLNTGDRTVPFTLCESHKHFMFNIEF